MTDNQHQINILKKKNNVLTSLIEINQLLNSSLELETVLRTAIQTAEKYLGAQTSSILLIDPKTNHLNFYVVTGTKQKKLKKMIVPKGKGIAGLVAESGQAKLIIDAEKDPRFLKIFDQKLKFKTKTMIAVPLKIKNKTIGVLEIINKKDKTAFNKDELEFATGLASAISLAIENAKLFNQVTEEKNKIEAMLNNSNDGIVFIDTNNKIVFYNPSCSKILGQTKEVIIDQDFFSYLTPFQVSMPLQDWLKSSKKSFRFEMALKEFLDTVFLAEATKIIDIKKQTRGLILIFRNISELKKISKMKSEFVSIISHKLRTPLTTIEESLNLFLEGIIGDTSKKQKEILSSMKKQSLYLKELINRLLDFSEIERKATNISLKKENISIESIVEDCEAELKTYMIEKESTLIIQIKNKIPPLLLDKSRIKQAIKHLLENAIKFSPIKSKILVSIYKSNNFINMDIKDNGPGIPKHELSYIFDSFYQIDEYKTGQIPGVGLGLPIAKQIIELHGGLINIKSTKEKGTTVTLSFPI